MTYTSKPLTFLVLENWEKTNRTMILTYSIIDLTMLNVWEYCFLMINRMRITPVWETCKETITASLLSISFIKKSLFLPWLGFLGKWLLLNMVFPPKTFHWRFSNSAECYKFFLNRDSQKYLALFLLKVPLKRHHAKHFLLDRKWLLPTVSPFGPWNKWIMQY